MIVTNLDDISATDSNIGSVDFRFGIDGLHSKKFSAPGFLSGQGWKYSISNQNFNGAELVWAYAVIYDVKGHPAKETRCTTAYAEKKEEAERQAREKKEEAERQARKKKEKVERRERKEEADRKERLELEKMKLDAEMKLLQAKIEAGIIKNKPDGSGTRSSDAGAKHPKLPNFQDDLDI
ncbi:reverse transcriptase [Plakobranchus ocellatus]|uniref:Reverse transcriptase n=1 Tax=Plakobranchus ocellatus TaxID=259542 RepID=A0AAV4CDK6_9GAST|nr:reverse transcriptase [Plakobranchus ocellatus]